MQSNILRELRDLVEDVGKRYSDPERKNNNFKDSFTPVEIKVLSETTAAVYFLKSESKKLCLMFFYYVNASAPYWAYFIPTDAHLLGLSKINKYYDAVEEHNKKVVLNGIQ